MIAALIILGVVVYLIGVPIAARCTLSWSKRNWPSLSLDDGDYAYAGFVGLLWPAHLFVFGSVWLALRPLKLVGWLSRKR